MKNSFGWLLIGLSLTATAAIYQQRDAQGQLIFTDQPSAGAQPVLLPSPTNGLTIKTTSQPSSATQSVPTSSNLQFTIAKPYDQQTFHNQRRITVQLTVIPALTNDDRIQLQLDGKPYGTPQATTQFVLENLARGTHTLQAQLLTKQDSTRQTTPTITIYVHYASLLPPAVNSAKQNNH